MKRAIKNKSKEFTVILRKNSLDIAILATMLVIITLASASTYLFLQSPPSRAVYRQEVREYFRQITANRDFKKYAGSPQTVVAEERATPYSLEKREKKPVVVNQLKATKPVAGRKEDSEQFASLAPDKEPAAK